MASVNKLDWPGRPGLSRAAQQQELTEWLVQTLQDGSWSRKSPVFKGRSGITLKEPAETVVLRAVSDTGMLSLPVVWSSTGP